MMNNQYIVEIDPGCWLCGVQGDPGRTMVKESAQRFESMEAALLAIEAARKYRPFENAAIESVRSVSTC